MNRICKFLAAWIFAVLASIGIKIHQGYDVGVATVFTVVIVQLVFVVVIFLVWSLGSWLWRKRTHSRKP